MGAELDAAKTAEAAADKADAAVAVAAAAAANTAEAGRPQVRLTNKQAHACPPILFFARRQASTALHMSSFPCPHASVSVTRMASSIALPPSPRPGHHILPPTPSIPAVGPRAAQGAVASPRRVSPLRDYALASRSCNRRRAWRGHGVSRCSAQTMLRAPALGPIIFLFKRDILFCIYI